MTQTNGTIYIYIYIYLSVPVDALTEVNVSIYYSKVKSFRPRGHFSESEFLCFYLNIYVN
jgi:hypothetical protein